VASNSFGKHFRITTFGESHGPAIGVIVDGVPPLLDLDLEAVQRELDRRKPGQSDLTTPRAEGDRVEVMSGVFEGKTTGAPLCLQIRNKDARPGAYDHLQKTFRPGHADYTLIQKYGIRDHRGGGRSSGRETATRVAAGAIAKQLLAPLGVSVFAHVAEVGGICAERFDSDVIETNPVRCADEKAAEEMAKAIAEARDAGDSLGAVVEVRALGVPAGWGDPTFDKLDARLAFALMTIGAIKGVEIGAGFGLAKVRGSQSNDEITPDGFATNRAGGILGGISSGEEIVARIAVKPTSSIKKTQQTIDTDGKAQELSVKGRHDPCIAPRVVPVAEAMVALVLVDAWLAQRMLTGK
jgi:chorismate synthase